MLTYAGAKLQRVTDPAGRHTQFQHDIAGNLIRITNPDGQFLELRLRRQREYHSGQ